MISLVDFRRSWLAVASVMFAALVLVAWQYVPAALGVPKYIIPRVSDLVLEMHRMWMQENLLKHVVSTASVALLGFVIGGVFGAVSGYLLGASRFWEQVLSPYILALQIAPKVAFAPLFILWFGYNIWPKLVVTVLVVFFPILVNVLQSMRTVDRDLVNLARAYSMSRWQIFVKIRFPSSVPNLMAGLRIGATLAVIGVTVGELVGGETGLGFLITYGEGQADTAMVFDAIFLLTLIGIAMYWVVAAVEDSGAALHSAGDALMLAGRTVLVTGAARGVGRAIAVACAAAGARLVLADVLEDAGRETVEALRAGGADVRFVAVDLGDPASIARLGEDVAAVEGVLHGLVNNAAIATGIGGPMFDEIALETWDRVMQVNVRGTWLVTRAMAPLLEACGSGRVVNVASDTALWGAPRLLAYVASKGAVMAMTRSLAREMGPRGRVGVVAVAPGIMRNEATAYVPAERHRFYEEGRAVPGAQVPEDICDTVVFLLTPGALALTGQVLPVNAGFVFT